MSAPRLDPLSEQAIDWMVKLRAGQPDAELQERFNAWLAMDPAHPQAWATLQERLGGSFNTLRALDRRIPGQAAQARQLLTQPQGSRCAAHDRRPRPARWRPVAGGPQSVGRPPVR